MRALLQQLKVKDLRTLAKGVSKDLSIAGYSKMSKPKLVDELHKLAMRVPDVKAQFSPRLSLIPSIQEYGGKKKRGPPKRRAADPEATAEQRQTALANLEKAIT